MIFARNKWAMLCERVGRNHEETCVADIADALREAEEALEAAKKWVPTLAQVSEADYDQLQADSYAVESALKKLRGQP